MVANGKAKVLSPKAPKLNQKSHVDLQKEIFDKQQLLNNLNNAQKMSEIADTFKQARLKIVQSQKAITPRGGPNPPQKKDQKKVGEGQK